MIPYYTSQARATGQQTEGTKMTTSKPSLQELQAKAEELYWNECYDYLGIRSQNHPFELGPIDHASNVWEDGENTGEELDGICATDWEHPAIACHSNEIDCRLGCYLGEHVAILGSNSADFGEDEGELIMQDAQVLYVFC